jgi:hypothetical protein
MSISVPVLQAAGLPATLDCGPRYEHLRGPFLYAESGGGQPFLPEGSMCECWINSYN